MIIPDINSDDFVGKLIDILGMGMNMHIDITDKNEFVIVVESNYDKRFIIQAVTQEVLLESLIEYKSELRRYRRVGTFEMADDHKDLLLKEG